MRCNAPKLVNRTRLQVAIRNVFEKPAIYRGNYLQSKSFNPKTRSFCTIQISKFILDTIYSDGSQREWYGGWGRGAGGSELVLASKKMVCKFWVLGWELVHIFDFLLEFLVVKYVDLRRKLQQFNRCTKYDNSSEQHDCLEHF